MRKKPNIKASIKEASDELKKLMVDNLALISGGMIDAIMGRVSRLPDSQKLTAIKDVPKKGIADYKTALLDAMAVISKDALDQARKEVPKAKGVKLGEIESSLTLGEFESLPPKLRKKILAQSQLLIDSQMNDLDKAIYFQFTSSIDSTDSLSLLQSDLETAADDFISGATVYSGAGATASGLINSARNAFFLDDDVTEQIDAFEFTNGDPVSPICEALAGTVFAANDPNLDRYWPPLHWNCKSYVIPILKGNLGNKEITTLNPSKTAQDSIQFSESNCSCGCGQPLAEGSMVLQSVIVSKSIADSAVKAETLAKSVGASTEKIDETETSYRFRQKDPADFIDGSFRTKEVKPGVSMVFGKLRI